MVADTSSPGINGWARGANESVLLLTWAGVAPRVRNPPRWAEYTFSAAAEAGVSAWLNVAVTGLVRAAALAFAVGETVVRVAWATNLWSGTSRPIKRAVVKMQEGAAVYKWFIRVGKSSCKDLR
jgi:hypothetical protein